MQMELTKCDLAPRAAEGLFDSRSGLQLLNILCQL